MFEWADFWMNFFLARWAHRILAKNGTKIANEIWWMFVDVVYFYKKNLKKHEGKTVSFVESQSWAIVAINRQDLTSKFWIYDRIFTVPILYTQ